MSLKACLRLGERSNLMISYNIYATKTWIYFDREIKPSSMKIAEGVQLQSADDLIDIEFTSQFLQGIQLCCGWLITAILMWIYFFALYGTKEDRWVNTWYAGIKDLSFSCGYAWILFLCVSGQAGILNAFLSWKIFHPVSRIGLCTYLTHIVIITRYGYLLRGFIEPELKTLVLWMGKIIPFSLASAFIVCLLFEAPMIRLFSLFAKHKFVRKKTD
ncbi:nose resistant to fluoxetine protein 6 [Nephila pilipes]|uniref:Nose resistant to fluoxetine protein 6 n=1 Tax=Nephila pilipes TaxID=299642 RepID=A0A8X6QGM5_NEPPI|nr:nose resistant to fluoxetine protein 6 [Nephila pilipes]